MEDIKRVYYGALVVIGAGLVFVEQPPTWVVGVSLIFGGFTGYKSKKNSTREEGE